MNPSSRHRTIEIPVSHETYQLLKWFIQETQLPEGTTPDQVADSLLHETLMQRPKLALLMAESKRLDKEREEIVENTLKP